MTKLNITNASISKQTKAPGLTFPKYATQLLNLANYNAHGTRPPVVGQLTTLFSEYLKATKTPTPEGWGKWYSKKQPAAIALATQKVVAQLENLKATLPVITPEMAEAWVANLIIAKTFKGLCSQTAIIAALAKKKNTTSSPSTPAEEAKGIDGYIGEVPVSVKPITYPAKAMLLPEKIAAEIIYYTEEKTGISVNYEI